MKVAFITQDGNTIWHDAPGPLPVEPTAELCDCHRFMGNDFYFMPAGECLRPDRRCNRAIARR